MGAGLVGLVLANHAHHSDRAFRVLVRMAHTALDTDNARGQTAGLYFAGWELLAQTLGRDVPPACGRRNCRCEVCERGGRCVGRNGQPRKTCSCEACAARENHAESVRRALRELVDAGVVEPIGQAHRDQRQAYRLHLTEALSTAPAGDAESPTAAVPLDPTAAVPLSPRKPHRSGGESPTAAVPPRKKEEPGHDEDVTQDPFGRLSASTTDRARGRTTRTKRRTGGIDWEAAAARAAARDQAAAAAAEVRVDDIAAARSSTDATLRTSG